MIFADLLKDLDNLEESLFTTASVRRSTLLRLYIPPINILFSGRRHFK